MKTVLVTGATDGIGRETAHQLLERGLRVLVHGRTLEKASRVVVELKRATPAAQVESVYADLADMREVLGLAQKVRAKTPVLDVLINNAGVYAHTRVITSDGFELTMAVNHFAPFLSPMNCSTYSKAPRRAASSPSVPSPIKAAASTWTI